MNEFKVGDVVTLNSGGPKMTISSIGSDGTISCTWFFISSVLYVANGEHNVYSGPYENEFSVGSLTLV